MRICFLARPLVLSAAQVSEGALPQTQPRAASRYERSKMHYAMGSPVFPPAALPDAVSRREAYCSSSAAMAFNASAILFWAAASVA
jgi:hypothetical protein